MKKSIFFIVWLGVFTGSYLFLSYTNLVPLEFVEINYKTLDAVSSIVSRSIENQSSVIEHEKSNNDAVQGFRESVLPDRLIIERIGIDTPVVNPETRDITVLDASLLEGVVRYPGSGGLEDESNMFLFGHSTNWTSVHNQAFKSLNRLEELAIGDNIRVRSGGMEYQYEVITVSKVDKDTALVEFSSGEKLITLSTCDTFGARDDRFVVTGRFIGSGPITRSDF